MPGKPLGRIDDSALLGAFEELPAILVVLVAVSLFSVSLAHAANGWGVAEEHSRLHGDCLAFADVVRDSKTLSAGGEKGMFVMCMLGNDSAPTFLEEFDTAMLGFQYRVLVQCVDACTGNVTHRFEVSSSEAQTGAELAVYHTCVNVECQGSIGAAKLTVIIWRVPA